MVMDWCRFSRLVWNQDRSLHETSHGRLGILRLLDTVHNLMGEDGGVVAGSGPEDNVAACGQRHGAEATGQACRAGSWWTRTALRLRLRPRSKRDRSAPGNCVSALETSDRRGCGHGHGGGTEAAGPSPPALAWTVGNGTGVIGPASWPMIRRSAMRSASRSWGSDGVLKRKVGAAGCIGMMPGPCHGQAPVTAVAEAVEGPTRSA